MPHSRRRIVKVGAGACAASIAIFGVYASGLTCEEGDTMDERLHAAAENGDVAEIRALLASGVKIDAINSDGETALLVATHGNQIEAARELIEAGADVN